MFIFKLNKPIEGYLWVLIKESMIISNHVTELKLNY